MSKHTDVRSVFVIFGRNVKLCALMFQFLEALALKPQSWRALTEGMPPSVHTFKIVAEGIRNCHVVIALLSGDEDVALRAPYFKAGETAASELELRGQARPNVFIEAGMALATKFNKTMLIRFGPHRQVSDLDGLNYYSLEGKTHGKDAIIAKLREMGCPVRRNRRRIAAIDFRGAIPIEIIVPGSEVFVFKDDLGKEVARARSLRDFYYLLKGDLNQDVFLRHLRAGDYANWFRDVFHDSGLAKDARTALRISASAGGSARETLASQILARYRLRKL
jgi:hypothetical protein